MNVVACRSCGAGMIWTETTNGRKMPVDAHPSPSGSFVLTPVVDEPSPLATFLPAGERYEGHVLYTSHFATCPNAVQHRKKGTR